VTDIALPLLKNTPFAPKKKPQPPYQLSVMPPAALPHASQRLPPCGAMAAGRRHAESGALLCRQRVLDWLLRDMPAHEGDGQLQHKMDTLAKMWGIGADCSGESLSKNDVLQRCSIGDVAAISKLKSRPLQTFADSTSALGLRVVGVLSALLEQQVPVMRCSVPPDLTRCNSCHHRAKPQCLPPCSRASREMGSTLAALSAWACGTASAS
jgi:hypothetical protein